MLKLYELKGDQDDLKAFDYSEKERFDWKEYIDESDMCYTDELIETIKEIFNNSIDEADIDVGKKDMVDKAREFFPEDDSKYDICVHYIDDFCSKIKDLESYGMDLFANVCMFLSYKYRNRLFEAWEEDKWKDQFRMNHPARKHYPCNCFDPQDPVIWGECEAYHNVMMSQNNISIFDFESNAENRSVQRYALPKTYQIYQDINREGAIYDLILLERTQGIFYTTAIYRNIKTLDKGDILFGKMISVVDDGMKIDQLFLRTEIIRMVFELISVLEYSSEAIEIALDMIGETLVSIAPVYEKMFRFVLGVYTEAYEKSCENKRDDMISVLKNVISAEYKKYSCYFVDEYKAFLEEERLHDFSGVTGIEDCFWYCDEKGLCPKDFNDYIADRMISVSVRMKNGIAKDLWVSQSVNNIGKLILDRVLPQIDKIYPMDEEEFYVLYNKKKEEEFRTIKADEERYLKDKEPKAKIKKLQPIHIFALVR